MKRTTSFALCAKVATIGCSQSWELFKGNSNSIFGLPIGSSQSETATHSWDQLSVAVFTNSTFKYGLALEYPLFRSSSLRINYNRQNELQPLDLIYSSFKKTHHYENSNCFSSSTSTMSFKSFRNKKV